MKQNNTAVVERKADMKLTVGLDLGDRFSYYCVLSDGGEKQSEGTVATQAEALAEWLGELGPACSRQPVRRRRGSPPKARSPADRWASSRTGTT